MEINNLKEELDILLDNLSMDEDWDTTLGNNGWKITIENESEDSDLHSTCVSWYIKFKAEKNDKVFSCYLDGTASKEISYDRLIDTVCYVVTDYDIVET